MPRCVAFPGGRSRVALTLAAVLALHLAAIVGLNHSWKTPPSAAAPVQRVSLRLIPLAPPSARQPPARPTAVPSTQAPAATRLRKPAPSVPRDAPEPVATHTAAAAAITPEPAASAPDTLPSLMDADATRRAIRDSARAPSLGDQLAQSREEPRRPGANDRLANGVHSAGKGDCMKGEYAGANMGILSLPFLAIALKAGHCAK